METRKIIFLIPTLNEGGGERVVSELSLNLPDYVERTIVLFKNETIYSYKGKLICLGIPLSNSLFFRFYYFLLAVARFKKIVKVEKPDYVISFGIPANIINILSNKKTIIRVDTFLSSISNAAYKFLIKFLYNRAFKIVCVSNAAAEDLEKNFKIEKKNIKVIYNPLNIKKIQKMALEPIGYEYEKIFKKPTIITTGRLVSGKNHLQLVKIFKEVKNTIKDAQLVILGSGPMEAELKKVIGNLGIESSVHLLGWQKNPFKFLAKSKVFVLASLQEGLPYSILEAMAVEIPIISTDCKAGPREILAPDTNFNKEAKRIEYSEFGILTPLLNKEKGEECLAKAIREALTDKKLAAKLAQKSRQRADDFDVKNIIKKWNFLEKNVKIIDYEKKI